MVYIGRFDEKSPFVFTSPQFFLFDEILIVAFGLMNLVNFGQVNLRTNESSDL